MAASDGGMLRLTRLVIVKRLRTNPLDTCMLLVFVLVLQVRQEC